jgi:hypothetical protein
MCLTRCAPQARKGPRRVVHSVVTAFLGWIAALVLVGCTSPSHAPQSAAGPQQGEEVAPEPPLRVGEMAPDFALRGVDGGQERLSDYRGRMPIVIEFGSLTCPIVAGHCDQLDALAQDYQGKAQFWFVYGNEVHPGRGEMRSTTYGTYQALPQVRDYDDRRERAARFQSTMETIRRVLVDEDGADSVASRYHLGGPGIVVVDVDGRVCWVGAGPEDLPDLADVIGATR